MRTVLLPTLRKLTPGQDCFMLHITEYERDTLVEFCEAYKAVTRPESVHLSREEYKKAQERLATAAQRIQE